MPRSCDPDQTCVVSLYISSSASSSLPLSSPSLLLGAPWGSPTGTENTSGEIFRRFAVAICQNLGIIFLEFLDLGYQIQQIRELNFHHFHQLEVHQQLIPHLLSHAIVDKVWSNGQVVPGIKPRTWECFLFHVIIVAARSFVSRNKVLLSFTGRLYVRGLVPLFASLFMMSQQFCCSLNLDCITSPIWTYQGIDVQLLEIHFLFDSMCMLVFVWSEGACTSRYQMPSVTLKEKGMRCHVQLGAGCTHVSCLLRVKLDMAKAHDIPSPLVLPQLSSCDISAWLASLCIPQTL